MLWQPPNLTEICPVQTNLSACTSFGYMYLNLLAQLFGGPIYKGKEETEREEESKESDGMEYDFIVVGAGAAGCVIANRLTEDSKWKVLLVEAGPEEPKVTLGPAFSTALLGSSIDWQYTLEPNGKSCFAYPGTRCRLPRGKTMGGSTSINSLAYIRGNRADYDGWAAMGNDGWSYEEVLPFFRKSEKNMNIGVLNRKYHGTKGEQYVSWYPYIDKPARMMTKAFVEGGLPLRDYNGAHQVGSMQAQAISLEGERVSAYVAFIQPIRDKRPNLVIKTNSEATKILIDNSNNAYGIIYVKGGIKYTAYAKKEVIISGGVVNSPKLLMLSGIGPKDHLERLNITVVKDLPVGKNLHDHVSFDGMLVAISNKTATTVSEEEVLSAVKDYDKMTLKRGPLSGNGPASTLAFMKTEPDLIAPDIQFHTNHIANWREFLEDPIIGQSAAVLPTAYYDAMVPRPMILVPKSRGYIELNETDPNGPPLLFMNYLDDESDLIPLLKAVRFLLSLENTKAFRTHGAYFIREKMRFCKQHEWGTDDYFICLMKSYTASTHHAVGTCKMGPAWDKTAVLDNELRVYGVGRLRVIDASMMPCIVRGNTNAPTLMIGERGVDFVIKYWRNLDKN